MSVFDLKSGQKGRVTACNLDGAAANRVYALGIEKGKEITVLGFSLFKSSVLIGVGHTRVAIRKNAAVKIGVELC